jgi:CRISPR-associated protein Cas2
MRTLRIFGSRQTPWYYVICYDIRSPKRLAKVLKTMHGWGEHVQYSVFVCRLTASELSRCCDSLRKVMDEAKDQIAFFPPD